MQIFDDTKKRVGTLSGFRNREITRTLDSGDKELVFEYPAHGEMVDLLKEEYYIRTKTDEFVLRAVEKAADWNKYTAQLNVEELEGQAFPYGFASQEQTIRACLEFAFEGTGWKVGTCTVTKKRTIDIEESTTAWNVLQDCLSTYRCECDIDTLNKTVNIYETIGQDRGCYFMEGLNLRKLSINSDTYEFYTRIIPIGKDGITIEWLHGKEYLENYQFSKKIKTYTWKDERYTNTTSLMEDAEAKLDEMSRPYKAYTADVVDLAKANPEYSSVLDYGIGDTVTLVSKRTGTREKQRIVKITEFPETPEKNTVELSNVKKTFAEVQKSETELAKQDAISIANSTTKKTLQDYSTTEEIETKITASKEAIELGVTKTLKNYVTTTTYEAGIKVVSDEISSKVAKDDFGTLITQNAYNVKIAWNKNSNYIQFEGTGITLYNGTIDDNQKRTVFNYTGMHFYLDGYYVGKIGTNNMKNDSSLKGLVFDLETQAAFMSWSNKDGDKDDVYTMKWSYCTKQCGTYEAGLIHAGTDIDMHYWKIKNVTWEDGGITATIDFVQVLSMNSDGTVATWGSDAQMVFKNGILTNLKFYAR